MLDKLWIKHQKTLQNLSTTFKSSMHGRISWDEKLIGIMGARGVGKTTLILQYIKEKFGYEKSCLYLSLDDIAFPYENLVELADDFEKAGGKHLFIDEIHKYQNWAIELKNIYDSYPGLQIVFTGSSILEIINSKADLSRRAVTYHMQGLSFREFVQIQSGKKIDPVSLPDLLAKHEQISREIQKSIKPFQHFSEYLRFGYYPYYLQNIDTYHIKLSNTISLILETDLPMLQKVDVKYIGKLKKFLNMLSASIPFKPNVSNLAAAIGISWQSVINYLSYLNDAEIIKIVYHVGKGLKSLSKPEMIYLHHPNHFFVFRDEISDKGSMRESFFVNQISYLHKLETLSKGDFLVDEKYLFEIGGKNKTYHQIAGIDQSFVAADNIEQGFGNKIPLWLFGFLY